MKAEIHPNCAGTTNVCVSNIVNRGGLQNVPAVRGGEMLDL